jgi:TonB family protein
MRGLQRKCFVGSIVLHGLLLLLVVVGSAFIPKSPPPPPPAFELFDAQAILLDQPNIVSGGNPNATAPPIAAPPTVAPAPQAVTAPPEQVKPATKLPDPPKETARQPEPKVQPEPEPVKPEKLKKPDPDAFDLSKAVTKTPQTRSDKTEKIDKEKASTFDLSKAEKKTIKPAKEASDGEENARADKEKKLAMARAEAISGALKSVHGGLSKGGTSYDIPGPGGAAYASYDLYLKKLYETAWIPPQAGRGNEPAVEVELVIARDGTVLSRRVIKASGRRELDNSVNTVLRRITKARPLPEGSTDAKRTFRINFNLTETPSVE